MLILCSPKKTFVIFTFCAFSRVEECNGAFQENTEKFEKCVGALRELESFKTILTEVGNGAEFVLDRAFEHRADNMVSQVDALLHAALAGPCDKNLGYFGKIEFVAFFWEFKGAFASVVRSVKP